MASTSTAKKHETRSQRTKQKSKGDLWSRFITVTRLVDISCGIGPQQWWFSDGFSVFWRGGGADFTLRFSECGEGSNVGKSARKRQTSRLKPSLLWTYGCVDTCMTTISLLASHCSWIGVPFLVLFDNSIVTSLSCDLTFNIRKKCFPGYAITHHRRNKNVQACCVKLVQHT